MRVKVVLDCLDHRQNSTNLIRFGARNRIAMVFLRNRNSSRFLIELAVEKKPQAVFKFNHLMLVNNDRAHRNPSETTSETHSQLDNNWHEWFH